MLLENSRTLKSGSWVSFFLSRLEVSPSFGKSNRGQERGGKMGQAQTIGGSPMARPLSDDYRYVRGFSGEAVRLGKGAFSHVYKAELLKSPNTFAAVKEIGKADLARSGSGSVSERAEMLRREVTMLKSMRHPSIVKLHGVYEDDSSWFAALELLEGGDFQSRLDNRQMMANLKERQILFWMHSMVDAIAFLHSKRILHRDIKPANWLCVSPKHIFVGPLKLADFGSAVHVPAGTRIMMPGLPPGTPAYMAPEMLNNDPTVGYGLAADVWALGVILCQLLNEGQHPFAMAGKLNREAALSAKIPSSVTKRRFSDRIRMRKKPFSTEVTSLCEQMLQVSPTARMSAHQVKALPLWLKASVD